MTTSVAFTDARMTTKSCRARSASCASRCSAVFVITRGLRPTLVFAPSFFFETLVSASEFAVEESAGVLLRGVGGLELTGSSPSSSSIPKDSLPFATTLRFFLNRGFGMDALYFAN